MAIRILLGFLLCYAAVCLLAFLFQGRLLFPVAAARSDRPLPPGAERLSLEAPDGTKLVGVHLAPFHSEPGAPLILGFGGNAWNADAMAEYLRDLYPGTDVVAFHYRGYAPSGGTPGAEALAADSLLVFDDVARRFPGRRIVTVGFSIGSGLAAHVAAQRSVAGAILVTPFDSLAAVAAGHSRWLPVRLLWRHKLEPAAELRGSKARIAILAGGADTLIPPPRAETLRRAVGHLVFDRTIPGAGHNDIYGRSDFQQAAREALAAVLAS